MLGERHGRHWAEAGPRRTPTGPAADRDHRCRPIAGLAAAEVAARGGADVTLFERMPSPGRKLLLAGRGGLNLTHSEPLAAFLTRYGPAAAHARTRPAGLFARPPARLERGSRRADIRGVERPGVPQELQSLAPASRLVAAPRRGGGRPAPAPPLDRVDRAGRRRLRHAGRHCCFPSGCHDPRARRRELAAPGQRWRLDLAPCRGRYRGRPAASKQLPISGRLVGLHPRTLRGDPPQGYRRVLRGAARAGRPRHHPRGD